MLEGLGHVGMAAIGVGGVEKTQAMVVTVQQQVGEAFDSQGGLVRMVTASYGSCAHCQSAGSNAGAAEKDCVRGTKLLRGAGRGHQAIGRGGSEPRGRHSISCL